MKYIPKIPLSIAISSALVSVAALSTSAHAIPNAAGMAAAEDQIQNTQQMTEGSITRTTYIQRMEGSRFEVMPLTQTTISEAPTAQAPPLAKSAPTKSAPATKSTNADAKASKPATESIVTEPLATGSEAVFYDCASIISDAMRLACYDTIAQGETPTTTKRQIKIGKTILETVRGNPQLVYAEPEEAVELSSVDDTPSLAMAAERFTPLSLAYDLDRNNAPLWSTRPHEAMYILPMYVSTRPNRQPSTPTQAIPHEGAGFSPNEMRTPELKFQLSFKVKAMEDLFDTDADLWVGYTQQSHWQVYNEDNSRQFRAHDYHPEVFLTQPIHAELPLGGKMRMLGAGFMHHSNGEKDPLSRSWNRAYLMAGMEWGKLTVIPRLWARIADGEGSGKPDDNPDILDYYGYGDVKFLYQLDRGNSLSGTARFNPGTNKGALQLDYVHPLGKGISGYVQLFQGYGQSIIDYNHESTSVGIGIMLNDWMGL